MPENWTPGPWYWDCHELKSHSAGEIVLEESGFDFNGIDVGESDADLIAAAPELFEVLRRLVEDGDDTADVAMDGMRALAKARGEDDE